MQESLEHSSGGTVVPTERRLGNTLSTLTRRWLLVAAAVASLLSALVLSDPQADPDLFARTAVGRLIEVNGGVTDQDPFAFTPLRDRFIDHEWLAGVVFYRVADLGGEWGLVLLNVIGLILMVVLVVRAQHERSGASLGWSTITLLYLFGAWIKIVRSRAFTMVGVGLLLFALVRWRDGRPGWLWLLPPWFLVWTNAHGGYVAGLGLLGAATVAATLTDARKALPLWACLAACFAVTFVNPYGLDYWRFIIEATGMERPDIVEWQPLRPWQIGLVVVLGSIYLAGVAMRWRVARPLPETIGMLVVSVWAAADSQRLLNFLLLVLVVYGAAEYRTVMAAIGRTIPATYRAAGRHLLGVAAIGMVVIGTSLSGWYLIRFAERGLGYTQYPVGAIEWLERHGAGGRVLTHFNHGSFALWRLYPLYQVAIDGRYEETYPHETVDMTRLALQPTAPGHAAALRAVDPDYIVVPGVSWARDFGPPWVMVYQDETSAVLARPGLEAGADRPVRPMWQPGF
jgi:hypothetical protein